MKKILILSCNTGEGHNSAARAIDGFLKAKNIECEVLDTLSIVGAAVSKAYQTCICTAPGQTFSNTFTR